jgi:crotonobetainyl-CoA:carnitine CoA-transferase CaiB-like acyl-CoA transferase
VAVGSEGLWRKFAPVVGLDPEDPRFAQNRARVERRDELIALVDAAFGDRLVDDVLADLAAAGVPAGEVRTLDRVYDWEQTRSQGLLVDVEHSSLGTVTLPGPPLRFDGAAAVQHRPPPRLDEHGAQVRAWLEELETARLGEAGPA